MEIPITIKSHDATFKQNVDVPTDMTVGELRDAAKEKANLSSVDCHLIRDKTNTQLKDNETIENAGIQPGDLLILTPNAEGG